ncbi:DUF5658 family protein [Clostridium cibarium]|uniref:DUF5658 family protein n=1 Tax=Clostridium cibarium TaxID=2762247 RepID=UPI003C2C4B54
MKSFITGFNLNNIKIKFIILYIFNVTDIFFTLILYKTGYFLEANLFMRPIISDELLSIFVKLTIPAFLLIILNFRIQKATNSELKKSNIIILSILLIYIFINISHLLWILYYIFLI